MGERKGKRWMEKKSDKRRRGRVTKREKKRN